MSFIPSVIRAEYRGGYRLRLTFNDGSAKTVDFAPGLEGPVFEPLEDEGFFCGSSWRAAPWCGQTAPDASPSTSSSSASASLSTGTRSSLVLRSTAIEMAGCRPVGSSPRWETHPTAATTRPLLGRTSGKAGVRPSPGMSLQSKLFSEEGQLEWSNRAGSRPTTLNAAPDEPRRVSRLQRDR